VLPFQNLSGEPEHEYFADGMVEEIITALSRFQSLFVIARNSSFTYKGRAVDVRQVGRELGVRYVLEGSVRKSGSRVRIAGQLIDAATGAHLWADRFDGAVGDIFDLQDQITMSVVGAIEPRISRAESDRAWRKPPESLDSYDYILRGMACVGQGKTAEALNLFYKAIDLDPGFGVPHAWAAFCIQIRGSDYLHPLTDQERDEALRLVGRALELAHDHHQVLTLAAYVFNTMGDFKRGAALADRSIALNLNGHLAWTVRGWASLHFDEPETAIEAYAHTLRLNPLSPSRVQAWLGNAWAYLRLQQNDQSLFWATKALQEHPTNIHGLVAFAIASARVERVQGARDAIVRLREAHPDLLKRVYPYRTTEELEPLAQFLRGFGLPD
jgi:TolB-like protein